VGAALALLSSLTWGVADFMGGIASRKRSVLQVLVIAYPVGAVVLTGVAIFVVPGELSRETFTIGAIAGAIGATAIGCLYVALKRGPMGIVSPITAVMSAAIPVFFGLLNGERLNLLAVIGMISAAIAVILVSQEVNAHQKIAFSTIAISLTSGSLIGTYLTLIGTSSDDSGIWTATIARWFSSILVLGAVLATVRKLRYSDLYIQQRLRYLQDLFCMKDCIRFKLLALF
jgi:drug/metabolite transporter (DMT)-like permease